MMKRQFWGVVITILGVLALLQVLKVYQFGLAFWPVVLLLGGLAILWSSFKRLNWFGLALGLWVGGIGLFDILANAEVSTITGGDIAKGGWPLLLVAVGVSTLFGRNSLRWIYRGWDPRNGGSGHAIGEFRLGQGGTWVLDSDVNVSHGIGDVRVDLTTADITDGVHKISVHAGIGDLVVRVPDNVNVIVTAKVGLGDLECIGEHRSGVGPTLTKTVIVPDSGVTLEIDAELGLGDLDIVQRPSIVNRVIR